MLLHHFINLTKSKPLIIFNKSNKVRALIFERIDSTIYKYLYTKWAYYKIFVDVSNDI